MEYAIIYWSGSLIKGAHKYRVKGVIFLEFELELSFQGLTPQLLNIAVSSFAHNALTHFQVLSLWTTTVHLHVPL